jgi:two-component system, OmpR family, response regulator
MAGASTIVIAREDLSIPGLEVGAQRETRRQTEIESQFFALIHEKRPDVIVLDLRDAGSDGIPAIRKIRQRSDISIVVIRDEADQHEQDYRIAGAAECLPAPVDIIVLNGVIQKIMRINGTATARKIPQADTFEVEGMIFQPRQNILSANGASIQLTTAENHLLLHFISRPWIVCRRAEIAEILYDKDRPASDRAIDVVVTRLRKKLTSLRGLLAENLIKTEFRTGYMFVGDVSKAPLLDAPAQGHG